MVLMDGIQHDRTVGPKPRRESQGGAILPHRLGHDFAVLSQFTRQHAQIVSCPPDRAESDLGIGLERRAHVQKGALVALDGLEDELPIGFEPVGRLLQVPRMIFEVRQPFRAAGRRRRRIGQKTAGHWPVCTTPGGRHRSA
eukprot:CAMPEP_0198528448 /NCGR_PEP_ID=MMETSP1462-20131121/25150_1 /TAXON_ID=1333877 /ORGANISM="Brandtodinium nutriculum, Strain RCC3387" /LENGTH=140 /DNA_ID=CAMNT_0044258273 /DNA_START=165 /DNA_END=584 /DNA_ORIENTATION=-